MTARPAEPSAPAGLPESKALFVRRWGEMSSYWGINRTMAEIHALLYVSTEPVCTDDVMALLQVSRGNASMNLRSLVDWGLIERVHLRGDRKEYFRAQTDVWQMFETILRQRKRREVGPIAETIQRCREIAASESGPSRGRRSEETREYLRRLEDMHSFLEVLEKTLSLVLRVGPKGMDRISGLMMKIAG